MFFILDHLSAPLVQAGYPRSSSKKIGALLRSILDQAIVFCEGSVTPLTQALHALKRYHKAQAAGQSAEEVERLRLEAEDLFQAVSEFQLRMPGAVVSTNRNGDSRIDR